MNTAMAETLALKALGWLAGQEGQLQVFLGASGMTEQDLRTRADDPEMLAAVLDFLMMDDAWVMGFCDSAGHAYGDVAQARAALPGGQQMHWT